MTLPNRTFFRGDDVSGPPNQTVAISHSDRWVRLERRKYSRLTLDIPITYRVVNRNLEATSGTGSETCSTAAKHP